MPGRDIKFVNSKIYHIFNKTTDRRRVFNDESLTYFFLDLLKYYRSSKSIIRYSNYIIMPNDIREFYDQKIIIRKYFLVDIYCFNVMPNHFHLLIKQNKDGGISHFMSNLVNSFTRFYNIKFDHHGSLFFKPFRAVYVQKEEQCKHVTRYIHLNRYSSGLVKHINDIFIRSDSSLPRYLNIAKDELVEKKFVMNLFGNDSLRYKKFVLDNADYQRSLERLKYVEKWI